MVEKIRGKEKKLRQEGVSKNSPATAETAPIAREIAQQAHKASEVATQASSHPDTGTPLALEKLDTARTPVVARFKELIKSEQNHEPRIIKHQDALINAVPSSSQFNGPVTVLSFRQAIESLIDIWEGIFDSVYEEARNERRVRAFYEDMMRAIKEFYKTVSGEEYESAPSLKPTKPLPVASSGAIRPLNLKRDERSGSWGNAVGKGNTRGRRLLPKVPTEGWEEFARIKNHFDRLDALLRKGKLKPREYAFPERMPSAYQGLKGVTVRVEPSENMRGNEQVEALEPKRGEIVIYRLDTRTYTLAPYAFMAEMEKEEE